MNDRPSSRLSAVGLVVALIGLAGLAGNAPTPSAPPPQPSIVRAAGPVDVNVASADQLATLPRIGPTLATRIVEDRSAHGRFATLDDLDRVPGVGPATVAELRAHAIAGPLSQ